MPSARRALDTGARRVAVLRAGVRRGLTRVLRRVPAGPLLRLRDDYVAGDGRRPADRARRAVLEVVRHRGVGEPVFAVPGDPEVRFAAADSLVIQRVYWLGREGWEPELVRWWPALCGSARSVLEVGANVGYYTVYGARAAPGDYTAVEPHPHAARTLRTNLELNGLGAVRVVEAAAVADERTSEVELLVPEFDHFAAPAGTTVAAASELHMRGRQRLPVAAAPFRSLLADVDLVKLDIEGQEHQLLHSALEELRARRPTICVELLEEATRLRSLLDRLTAECGYRALVPTRDSLLRLPAGGLRDGSLSARYGVRDVVLTCDPAALALSVAG